MISYATRRITTVVGSALLKGEKLERSTRRSRIYLDQQEILGAFYLFRERKTSAIRRMKRVSDRMGRERKEERRARERKKEESERNGMHPSAKILPRPCYQAWCRRNKSWGPRRSFSQYIRFASTCRESMLCTSKNKVNFVVRIHEAPGMGLLSSKRKMSLSKQTKEMWNFHKQKYLEWSFSELNISNTNEKFLLAHTSINFVMYKVSRY